MFFGLTNSPATFQTMMNDILQDLILEGVVSVYLDDILIYTKTIEEHRRVTRLVLDRLRQYRLFLQADKCEFEKTKIKYLGFGHYNLSQPSQDGPGEGCRCCRVACSCQ